MPQNSARKLKDLGAYAEDGIVGLDLDWTIDVVNPDIGDALTVHLNGTYNKGDKLSVRIYYRTDPSAQAFSWMKPSQTAGGVLPYMYS